MRMPNDTKQIFWDVKPSDLDAKKHKSFVITRIAEKGTWKDLKWLLKKYKKAEIKRQVTKSRNISDKTKNFWALV